MKLENQVCSLEFAKKLKELGVKQDSLFSWRIDCDGKPTLHYSSYADDSENFTFFSAFTVAELGEMLPKYVTSEKCNFKNGFFVESEDEVHNTLELAEVNARAKMLIWLIENKKLEKDK